MPYFSLSLSKLFSPSLLSPLSLPFVKNYWRRKRGRGKVEGSRDHSQPASQPIPEDFPLLPSLFLLAGILSSTPHFSPCVPWCTCCDECTP